MGRKIPVEMAARWAVFELANFLNLGEIETDEFNVTGSVRPSPKREDISTFSYHIASSSFWVYVAFEKGQYFPISAMVKESGKFRYFSFVYNHEMEFKKIKEIQSESELWKTRKLPKKKL